MAYRPSLRSNWTLVLLAVIYFGLYSWCENRRTMKRTDYFEEKQRAAELTNRALLLFREATADKSADSSVYGDERLDALIGQQFTSITTDFGIFETKLLGANPNFAGIAVQLLKDAGVRKGDMVAIGMTGSHPGVNTAVLCACEVLGATPVTIASVGASWWGANDPDFTWVDMEKLLNDRKIVNSKPIAASMGGVDDRATGLSTQGQDAIRLAITRTGLPIIFEQSLPASISARMRYFEQAAQGKKYRAYINIGGGIASLGHSENAELVPNGLSKSLPRKNYPSLGLIHRFDHAGTSVINFHDIELLGRQYGLGPAKVPLPEVGRGEIFETERYHLGVASLAATIALIILIVLVRLDAKLFRLRDAGVDPDTLM